jgi:predicted nucleic acid-binding protein
MDPMMVLDTDVFIDHFRGQEAATAYIHSLPVEQRATTDITVMELYRGVANQQELATILRFLTHNRMTRLPVSTTASQRAVELVHQYGLAHGLGIPDALIAAIVLEGAHTPVTDNVRHFRFISGLQVLRAPYRPSPPSSPA